MRTSGDSLSETRESRISIKNSLVLPFFFLPLQSDNILITLMCTYSINIDENVMEQVRPSIAKGLDEDAWVQQHVEMYFTQLAASRRMASFDDGYMASLIDLSASSWAGVSDADKWVHELRGE